MFMSTQHQQRLVLRRFGGPEGFALEESAMPTPGPGEIRIRVLAACVHFTDLVMRQGKYPDLTQKPPLVLGYDVVGEVDDLGADLSTLLQLLADRRIRPLVADRIALADVPEAHRRIEAGQVKGKIVVCP